MPKSISVIGVYFGKFPDMFALWKRSAKMNKTIDWHVFTDNAEVDEENIHFHYMTLQQFNMLASDKMQMAIDVKKPYKICDFKPVYGLIFSDTLQGIDFWGGCDFDVVWGDIRRFITEDILEKHDKILFAGHFFLYRNTPEINEMWRFPVGYMTPELVFGTDQSFAFDENCGIYKTFQQQKKSIYQKMIYADISPIVRRFTCSDYVAKQIGIEAIHNYPLQVFSFQHGKIIREYWQQSQVKEDEFLYIHIQKRKMAMQLEQLDPDSFYMSEKGFTAKGGTPTTYTILKDLSRWRPVNEAWRWFVFDTSRSFQVYKRKARRALAILGARLHFK